MSCEKAAKQLCLLILNIDLFGQGPSFRVLGNKQFNTPLGALLTLVLIICTLTYLLVGIQDIITQASPNVLQSDRQVVETSPYPLLRNNFTIAITLTDINQEPLKKINKYFTITLKNCKTTRKINESTKTVDVIRNCTEIPMEACTMDHFLSQTQVDYFSRIKVGAFQCIQKDYWDTHPPVLQGIPTSALYQSLTVQVSACQNSTNKNDCAPLEDIKQQLGFGFYGLHLSDSLLQMDKPGNVALDIINLQYNTFSISSSKQIVQQFKVIDTVTDAGIVYTDYKQQQALIQDINRETTEQYNNQYIVLHNIYLNSKYSQYTRTYLKIQVVLSRVGGLYQLIFLLLTVLIKGIVQLQLDIAISNELYRFKNQSTGKENLRLSIRRSNVVDGLTGIIRSRKKLTTPRESLRDNNEENEQNIIGIHQNMNDYIIKKDSMGKGFLKILLIFLGCDRSTKKTLELAKEKYMNQLDVKNIIKKLYEIDQLKKIILTDEQQKLFGLLPKPKIIEDFQQDNLFYQSMPGKVLPSQQLQEGYDAFAKMVSQGNKTMVDQKIISFIDPDILNIYQSIKKNSGASNQFLNEYPLNVSKRQIDQVNIVDSLQFIESENDSPQKVYTQCPIIKK